MALAVWDQDSFRGQGVESEWCRVGWAFESGRVGVACDGKDVTYYLHLVTAVEIWPLSTLTSSSVRPGGVGGGWVGARVGGTVDHVL